MLKTEEAAFILQHRIDIKEYLGQFHGMNFTRNQNGWISGNVLVKPDNQWSDGKNWGNIVNWEARRNSCSPTQAVGIINSRVKAPYQFKSPHFQDLELVFDHVSKRYRSELKYNKKIRQFLEDEGIDISFAQNNFSLGAVEDDDELVDSLYPHYSEPIKFLNDLNLIKAAVCRFLSRSQSWVVPVKDRYNEIQGFHGFDIKGKAFHTGWLYANRHSVLFGEAIQTVKDAIDKKKRAIITDGVLDFLKWQQNNYPEILASTSGNIAPSRFDTLLAEPIQLIFFGFTEDKRRKKLIGLALQHLKSKPIKFTNNNPFATKAKVKNLEDIINNAMQAKTNEDQALWKAALTRNKELMKMITDEGLVYRIKIGELREQLEKSKGSHKKLQMFLEDKRLYLNNLVKEQQYITISANFIGDDLNSELRTLLFLLSNKNENNPVRFSKSKLAKKLGIKVRRLSDHLRILEAERYVLKRHENFGKKVVLHLEPSSIPFILKGSIK